MDKIQIRKKLLNFKPILNDSNIANNSRDWIIQGLELLISAVEDSDINMFNMDSFRTCIIGELTVLNTEQTTTYDLNVAMLKLFGFCDVYSTDSKAFSELNSLQKSVARLLIKGYIKGRILKVKWLEIAKDTLKSIKENQPDNPIEESLK